AAAPIRSCVEPRGWPDLTGNLTARRGLWLGPASGLPKPLRARERQTKAYRKRVSLVQSNRQRPVRVLCLLASVPLAATAVILWRGTIPVLSTATYNDKVAHFLVFGALAVLCVPFVRELSLLVRTSHGARVSLCGGYATAVCG